MDGADAAPPAVDAAVTEAPAPPPPATPEPSTPATPEPSTPATPPPEPFTLDACAREVMSQDLEPTGARALDPRRASAWDDRKRGLLGPGDAERVSEGDLVDTVIAVGAFGGVTWGLCALDWSTERPWASIGVLLALLATGLIVGRARQDRRRRAHSDALRRREAALRDATPLLDDARCTRPGRDRMALEGWRAGLRVELSANVAASWEDDVDMRRSGDALVLRIGAQPSSRRPRLEGRASNRGPLFGCPSVLTSWLKAHPEPLRAVAELWQRFQLTAATLGPDGVELTTPARDTLLTRERLDALLGAAVDLARASGLRPFPDIRVTGSALAATCPYCHGSLEGEPGEPIEPCRACATTHHAACLVEHGACAVHGCSRSRMTRAAAQDEKP